MVPIGAPRSGLDPDVMRSGEAAKLLSVAGRESLLERGIVREQSGIALDLTDVVDECGLGRPHAGIERAVHAARLVLISHRLQPAERRRERQERNQREVRDELEFETPHSIPLKGPQSITDTTCADCRQGRG